MSLSPDASRARSPEGIELIDVTKRFAGKSGVTAALDELTISVAEGEFVAILGPSGCGKSTALRIAAGLESYDSGTVSVGGGNPSSMISNGELGVAFQDNALLPWLSVRANIELPFRLARRPVDKNRVTELLTLVGLSEFTNARPAELSGGMKQRVSIARSIVLNPRVLLLDEPFGALDAVTRHRLNVELGRILGERRTTTLLVTHAVDEAVFLADRVVVMSGRPGRVKQTVDIPFGPSRTKDLLAQHEFQEIVASLTEALDQTLVGPPSAALWS